MNRLASEFGDWKESCIDGENYLRVVMEFDSWFLIPLCYGVSVVRAEVFFSSLLFSEIAESAVA